MEIKQCNPEQPMSQRKKSKGKSKNIFRHTKTKTQHAKKTG